MALKLGYETSLSTRPRWRGAFERPATTVRRLAPALAALAVLTAAPALAAERRGPARLDDAIRAADLVFEGTVEAVEFRNARGRGGKPGIPHTFVTWKIERIFKGRVAGGAEAITARFLGGMPNPDELLALADAPRPDLGDRDVVFLRRNGKSICPLVGCDDGRLRIVEDTVYDEEGRAFSVASDGTIRLGATLDHPAIARWDAVGIELVQGGEPGGDTPAPKDDAKPAPALSADALRAMLQARVAALYTPTQLARLRPVKSLDPDETFAFRRPRAVAPRAAAENADADAPVILGKPDPAEVGAFLANGRNPVLAR